MNRLLMCGATIAFAFNAASPAMAQINDTAPESVDVYDANKPIALRELEEAGERWRRLYEAGDWMGLRTLYTDDAVLMSQGQPKIEGADAILVFLQRLSQQGAKVTFAFAPEEVEIEGELGIVTAKYRMDIAFPGKDAVKVAGRSLLIYKWQDGSWKLWRDIDNFASDVTPEDFE
ncbi:MAG: DUF4440 domain-containing protein [Pseudomonadota bacterium]